MPTSLSHSVSSVLPPRGRTVERDFVALQETSAPQVLPWEVSLPPLSSAPSIVAAVTLTLVFLIAIFLLRRHIIHRTLSTRVAFELIPSNSFDPTPEEIMRFSRQLTRARPAESRWRPRRASSVRIRLGTTPEGVMAYTLSGGRGAASVLKHSAYTQVDVRSGIQAPQSETDPVSPGTDDREGAESAQGAPASRGTGRDRLAAKIQVSRTRATAPNTPESSKRPPGAP